MTPLRELNGLFADVKAQFERRNRQGLICKHGYYDNCCVLKLQKSAWTNDPMDQVRNQSGIFFSVWSDAESLNRNRILYNIHALKLRALVGYAITSRDFASAFRERFAPMRGEWPNVRVDYGPATLMQGWFSRASDPLGETILMVMERFERLSPVIDDLLEQRRK